MNSNIRIWEDPWIPNLLEFKPNIGNGDDRGHFWVSSLMVDDGNRWNEGLMC